PPMTRMGTDGQDRSVPSAVQPFPARAGDECCVSGAECGKPTTTILSPAGPETVGEEYSQVALWSLPFVCWLSATGAGVLADSVLGIGVNFFQHFGCEPI